jgi:hypothetical protein
MTDDGFERMMRRDLSILLNGGAPNLYPNQSRLLVNDPFSPYSDMWNSRPTQSEMNSYVDNAMSHWSWDPEALPRGYLKTREGKLFGLFWGGLFIYLLIGFIKLMTTSTYDFSFLWVGVAAVTIFIAVLAGSAVRGYFQTLKDMKNPIMPWPTPPARAVPKEDDNSYYNASEDDWDEVEDDEPPQEIKNYDDNGVLKY